VLHPQYKLQYFEDAGWEKDWIDAAKELVRKEFDKHYKNINSTEEVPAQDGSKTLSQGNVCLILLSESS
jgi:hypothetical protein